MDDNGRDADNLCGICNFVRMENFDRRSKCGGRRVTPSRMMAGGDVSTGGDGCVVLVLMGMNSSVA